ncbi:MAG: alpha/beta hydrolase [Deltaproteobacteria bacterium]|nr:alpha/beta hydrolase [Deltaproteobacteria bacterium]
MALEIGKTNFTPSGEDFQKTLPGGEDLFIFVSGLVLQDYYLSKESPSSNLQPNLQPNHSAKLHTPKPNFKISNTTTHGIGHQEIKADLSVKAYPTPEKVGRRFPVGRNFKLEAQRGLLYLPSKVDKDTKIILLLHGLGGRAESAEILAGHLAEDQNFIVFCPDLPGHGESKKPPLYDRKSDQGFQYDNPFEQAAVVRAWRDILSSYLQSPQAKILGLSIIEDKEPYIAGLSMGGEVAMAYYGLYNNVPGAYIACAWLQPNISSIFANIGIHLLPNVFDKKFDEAYLKGPEEFFHAQEKGLSENAKAHQRRNNYQPIRLSLAQYDPDEAFNFRDVTKAELGTHFYWLKRLFNQPHIKEKVQQGRFGMGMGGGDKLVPNRHTQHQAKKLGCNIDLYDKEGHYAYFASPEAMAQNMADVFRGQIDRCS